jgi:hypothetical protein
MMEQIILRFGIMSYSYLIDIIPSTLISPSASHSCFQSMISVRTASDDKTHFTVLLGFFSIDTMITFRRSSFILIITSVGLLTTSVMRLLTSTICTSSSAGTCHFYWQISCIKISKYVIFLKFRLFSRYI